jgi:hypothetical protein
METLIIQFTGYIYLLLALCFAIIFIMMKFSATEKDDYIDLSKYDVEVPTKPKIKRIHKNSAPTKVLNYLKTDEGKNNGLTPKQCFDMFNNKNLRKVIFKIKQKGYKIEKKKINNQTTYFLK